MGEFAQPPRLTGEPGQDSTAINQWLWDFYNAQKIINETVTAVTTFDSSTFDPNDLPDPATSSVGQAQQTANEAYALAVQAQATADALIAEWVEGTVTVTAGATTGTHTFATDQSDTGYSVILTPVSFTGAPVADSFVIVQQTYTTADFTITVATAPGVGNDVTFKFHLRR